MSREQIVALVHAMLREWNTRDTAGLGSKYAEDSVVQSPIFGTVRGRAEVERTYEDFFRAFADAEFELQDLIVDGSRAAQMFQVEATHTSELFGVDATHRKFRIQGVIVFEVRDGKIINERRMYDFTSLLVQLGVIKAKPGK